MDKRDLISQTVRYALVTGAAIAAVHVSTASAEGSGTPANLGKVTVTGTRIKRTDVETAQPITRISRQQIQKSGYTNVGDLLGRLSFAGGHANSSDEFSNGGTQVDLRNLGSNRVLVLVNGKRWLQGLDGTTNLNTVPTSIIDHIEILQDGASAVYGSDAIAGVVNIITIKNFRGAEAHAYYGIHNGDGYWDGQTKQYDVTIGGGNDRGNVVFNATYREQNNIPKTHRRITRTPVAFEPGYVGGFSNTPKGRFQLYGPAVSGRRFGQGTCGTYNSANPTNTLCDFTLINAPAQPSTQNLRNFRRTDQFNNQADFHLLEPLKNVSIYVQGHYDLFDNVTFTANASYVRGEAVENLGPDDIRLGANTYVRNLYHLNARIAATNPYNPFGVALVQGPNAPCITAGTCIGIAAILRHVTDGQPYVSRFNRDNFHIFAGFNGFVNLFNREIDWDIGFAQNRAQQTTLNTGARNVARIIKAVGPISQCTAPCVPLNLFGGATANGTGSITQSQLNYIDYEGHAVSQSNVRDWSANLSSDVYDLPAGPLGLAVGYERIDNYGYIHADAINADGLSTHGFGTLQNGRVVRNAEYAELNIPLLANLPGAKRLSVDIANRWAQFKRSGGIQGQKNAETFVHNSSGRLNIRWQVINDLLLRGSWSQGFRSPNVPDLFSGQSGQFPIVTDPCAGGQFGGYKGGALPSNCPNGTRDVQPTRHVNAVAGSNPNLQPEKSISRTVGFVYSPSQVPGLDINADYFKIELTNAIGTVGFQNILSGCFNNSSFCNDVTVSGNQAIFIRNLTTNVGSLLTDGIDVGLHYKFPSTPVGDFDARINGTFLKTFDQTQVNLATQTGFATSHLAGVGVHPKRRFNGYLDWDYGNWSAQYHIEYYGAAVEQCNVSVQGYCTYPNRTTNFQGAPGQLPLGRQHLGATVYHDVHVAYTVPSINTTLALGVNNLFDKNPPNSGTGGFQGEFNTSTYRLPSRLIYGSVRVRF